MQSAGHNGGAPLGLVGIVESGIVSHPLVHNSTFTANVRTCRPGDVEAKFAPAALSAGISNVRIRPHKLPQTHSAVAFVGFRFVNVSSVALAVVVAESLTSAGASSCFPFAPSSFLLGFSANMAALVRTQAATIVPK